MKEKDMNKKKVKKYMKGVSRYVCKKIKRDLSPYERMQD